ncbi:conserved Plasmodium protein, unknown function [Plasmodium gallinaceum]|uniref:Uncharacterized protein n=1 Tax=Plasmodium gallinaceum TaxID=5849 RepID=A0A1J1GPA0_PLAGA|nr:conserved Plasmodium protein, unknown function [Plasmodium gallinaceum]CRG94124.1 conserved Plasmodium protein, unknown function [Plasmodium gallinaceum]
MKIENSIGNEPFSVSQIIGDKLLQGWTLLNSSCHICNITPLIKQKNKEERFCVRCNLFIKFEKSESEEDTNDIKEKNEKKEYKENVGDPIKYIKEIKLQNEEFNEILNKNNISKDEIQNLFEYKNYIKERCGYEVGEWLNFDKGYNHSVIKNENFELGNGDIKLKKENEFYSKYENKDFLQCEKPDLKGLKKKDISNTEMNYNKYSKLEEELCTLNKTKDVFINKLEKYLEYLNKSNNKNEEMEYINKISNVITILEKVNNLKKNIIA